MMCARAFASADAADSSRIHTSTLAPAISPAFLAAAVGIAVKTKRCIDIVITTDG